MNLKNRETLLAVLATAVVALLIIDRLIIGPLISGWKDRTETIAELRTSINRGRTMIDRENVTRSMWNDMRRNTLPANASAAEEHVLEAFDRWTKESRVTVNSIKPQWKRGDTEDYSVLECTIDAAGDIGALTRFLHAVENTEIALRIESVTLTARDNSGTQLALDLAVSGLRLGPLGNN